MRPQPQLIRTLGRIRAFGATEIVKFREMLEERIVADVLKSSPEFYKIQPQFRTKGKNTNYDIALEGTKKECQLTHIAEYDYSLPFF